MTCSELRLVSPLSGPVLPLDEVPDPVFAERMMGDGVAIEPLSDALLSPCDGVVSQLHRAGHAVAVTAENGAEILMHVGIDTVRLGGRGFAPAVARGDRVRAGDVLVRFDADRVARAAPALCTAVIVASDRFRVAWRAHETVRAGASPLMTIVEIAEGDAPRATRAGGAIDVAKVERVGEAIVAHAGGLHARPAAIVRAAAAPLRAEVTLVAGERRAPVTSVVGMMALDLRRGDRVTIRARGDAAEAAIAAVRAAIETASDDGHDAPDDAPTAPSLAQARAGHCVVPGLAAGRAVRLDAAPVAPPPPCGDVDAEYARLAAALARAREAIAAAAQDASARAATHERDIHRAHLALLDDPQLVGTAERAVGDGASAGIAFRDAVRAQCAVLGAIANPVIAERVADLADLERRVLRAMAGDAHATPELFDASILVADDVALSELTRLPRARVAGLATARGGATSHVAILARALGVPAVVAMGPSVLDVPHGAEVVLDATAARVVRDPDADLVTRARAEMTARAARAAHANESARAPAITRDGHRVEVAANVGHEDDVAEAVRCGADGVGLVRTEVLFVHCEEAPPEEAQRAVYQRIVDGLDGRAAIVRTLDVGGDKPLAFLPMDREENPALGLRGVRVSLARPDLLDAQLRALLGVRPLASCRVLLPMIADAGELARVAARVDALCDAMGITKRPALGVMIEVPSAAVLADQLAARADFLSIGTNDLTQYTLAMDRGHPAFASALDGLHPAVLRLVAQTVDGAARHDKWTGVCGALASDLEAVPILVGLGVRELSVSPRLVPDVKARVRALDREACRREARAMLQLSSAAEVRARARAVWP